MLNFVKCSQRCSYFWKDKYHCWEPDFRLLIHLLKEKHRLVKEKQISASFIYKGVKFVVYFIKVNCFLLKIHESLLIVDFKQYFVCWMFLKFIVIKFCKIFCCLRQNQYHPQFLINWSISLFSIGAISGLTHTSKIRSRHC